MKQAQIPEYAFDLFSDEGILHPYAHYKAVRDLGPIVYLPAQDCYAVSRYADIRRVLADSDTFISGKGVSLNEEMNATLTASIITSDPPHHDFIRKIELEPVSPKALGELRETIFSSASGLLAELKMSDGAFDAVERIACYLPLSVVMELGGLPPVGREKMLEWAAAVFDLQGPMNARGRASLPALQALFDYVSEGIDRDSITSGSWADRAFRLADEGVVPPDMVKYLLIDFIAPSLDTTIAATANLLMLLGQNPDQWRLLKADPRKIPNAINESLRVETPIRCFSRYVSRDAEIDGVAIAQGARIAVFYASANRDERRWEDADRFDIGRRGAEQQFAFGHGRHSCVGANLARLEMTAIMQAMLNDVESFEIGQPEFAVNNLLRALKRLPIKLTMSEETE